MNCFRCRKRFMSVCLCWHSHIGNLDRTPLVAEPVRDAIDRFEQDKEQTEQRGS